MATQNTPSSPPNWLDRLLEWFCADEFLEIVQGDLHEMYHRNVREKGKFKARLCYLGDVLDMFRPFAFGFFLPHFHITNTGMYRNYLTTAFRNFRMQWNFALINVFGLAIGMAACVIILTYVSFELSFDDFHPNKNQLYRWKMLIYNSGGKLFNKTAKTSPPLSQLIRDNMPEVMQVSRLHPCPVQSLFVTIPQIDEGREKTSFNEKYAFFADASFLTMFDIRMLTGDANALQQPGTVILSETTAKRYFGELSEEILGKTLQIPYPGQKDTEYRITGIFQDLPPNTHLQADLLLSYSTLSEYKPGLYEDGWEYTHIYTYMQLHPQVSEEKLIQKKHLLADLANERYQTESPDPLELKIDYDLLRVDHIYLQSDKVDEIRPSGNLQTIYFLFIIGLLVIIIAWVNYVNLTTAKALQRAKEVGVRKINGASRGQLIFQFMLESFVMNSLAFAISFFIIWICLPYFRELTGKPLSYHLWVDGFPNIPLFYIVLGLMFFFSTLLSGFYPALVLSSFKPLKSLRGKLLQSTSIGLSLRSGLVIIQFTVSVILIAGTYLIYRQIEYMLNQPLGFNTTQMLVIQAPTDTTLKAEPLEVFKDDLLSQTFVEDAAASSIVPGLQIRWNWPTGLAKDQGNTAASLISIDHKFLETYDFTIIAGRNFSKDFSTDREAVILNETMANNLGFENAETALHEKMWLNQIGEKEIIGIVKNYHQSSLRDAFVPICILLEGTTAESVIKGEPYYYDFKGRDRAYLSVKINADNLSQNLELIEKKYKTYFPGVPFEYFFLDEDFNQQYKADIQFGKIFSVFASLAIFIACLGIFGLSSYMAVQKSKEIGIRKVLGATVTNIVVLLSGKFVRLVVISSLIALPAAYFVFDRWLENYAFRIEIGWWFFVIPALVVFLIALVTISVQTVKASLANPVDSLKYE